MPDGGGYSISEMWGEGEGPGNCLNPSLNRPPYDFPCLRLPHNLTKQVPAAIVKEAG